jgi:ribonuclease HII
MRSYFIENTIEAGCDEAGRGCLAGPVFAAAVILQPDFSHSWITDSKKLSLKKRLEAREIIENEALAWSVVKIDAEVIDKINILNASFLAMTEAVKKLSVIPELLLIDGNRFRTELKIPFQCIIKGDALYYSIAAASILAKTYRDEFMKKIHEEHPDYQWNKNKGYPTTDHQKALLEKGHSPYHRKSFQLKSQLSLF